MKTINHSQILRIAEITSKLLTSKEFITCPIKEINDFVREENYVYDSKFKNSISDDFNSYICKIEEDGTVFHSYLKVLKLWTNKVCSNLTESEAIKLVKKIKAFKESKGDK
ncbi:hypothetical protein [Mycoplasma sp. 4079]|uniref:hypothetical protein n=1 Tax=Mycoplasma sp. 4079 TaxID=3398615 RepID=UPI0039FC89AD